MYGSSFYVTLPSNTPYPGNKTNDFTVVLPEKLMFKNVDDWEVALVSLTYPNSFNLLGALESEFIEVELKNGTKSKFEIEKGVYDAPYKLCNAVQAALNKNKKINYSEINRRKRKIDEATRKKQSIEELEKNINVLETVLQEKRK